MKNELEINGKKYVLAEEETTEETAEETTAPAEKTPAEETPKVEEEVAEEVSEDVLEEAANKIIKKLGIVELHKSVQDLTDQLNQSRSDTKGKKSFINLAELLKKDPSELTVREKVIGFFQAAIFNDQVALKALSEGTAADGGYLFPDEFRAEIIRDLEEQPRMRNEVTVIPMRRDVMNIPGLAEKPKVTWTQENATKSTTTVHFSQLTLTARKMAAILYSSDELIADSTEIDVVDLIVSLFAEALGEEEDRVITVGNGTTEPEGYAVASGIGTRAVDGNLSFDDIIDLEYDLPQKYHKNAKFYVHRSNIRELRKLKDNDGRFIWQDPLAPTQPATIHGFPVFEDNNLSEAEMYFGDLKQAYWLGDRQKMTIKISQDTETAFTKDQTAIRVVARIAGTVVRVQALKKLNSIP